MLISIVVPVYNRRSFLPRLFASLVGQTYRPVEVVLVDNMSDDGSYEACTAFGEQHDAPGFSVVVGRERRRGGCACRNRGLELARGEYVYFFDSDDELSPDFLSDAAPFEPFDLICAPTVMVFPDGRTKRRDAIPTARPADHIISAMLSTQSFIVRKSFLAEAGGWNERLFRWNDWELGARLLLRRPRLRWLEGKAYHRIHQHAASISGKRFSDDFRPVMESIRAVRDDISRAALRAPETRAALRALSAKTLLFSAQLHREGARQAAGEARREALSMVCLGWRAAVFRLIYFAACHGMRGGWQLFRRVM